MGNADDLDRHRSAVHLDHVREQPCCIPGCQHPGRSQSHHLRHAQLRAMGMKPGDQWTVPLCAEHHAALHSRGDEVAYWCERAPGLDPLALARSLWHETQNNVDMP